ncbi:hypothetical protein ISS30_08560 [bacterium]|nr:hypothetical protein [bacterium]
MKILDVKSLAKKYPVFLTELAHQYLQDNQPDKAEKTLNRYLKKHPDDSSGLIVKGLIEEYRSEYGQAEDTYRQAIEFDSKCRRAYIRLNALEQNRNDASDYWKKAIFKVDPLNPIVESLLSAFDSSEIPAKDETIDEAEKVIRDEIEGQSQEETIEEPSIKSEDEIGDKSLLEVYGGDLKKSQDNSGEALEKISELLDQSGLNNLLSEFTAKMGEEPEESPQLDEELQDVIEGENSDTGLLDEVELKCLGEEEPEITAEKEEKEPNSEAELEGESDTETEVSGKLPEKPHDEYYEELSKLYCEIKTHQEKRSPGSESKTEKEIATATLGKLYAAQGEYEKALKIFHSLPEQDQNKYRDMIDKIRNSMIE